MLYTLLKFLGWGVLLAFIGACIGWALRSLKCRAEVARAHASTVDEEEVDRMRHRLANLEQVVAERDRLRIQLADVRHADSPGIVGAAVEPEPAPAPDPGPAPESEVDASPAGDETAGDEPADEAAAPLSIAPDTDPDEGAEPAEASTTVSGFVGTASDEPATDPPATDPPATDPPGTDESVALDLNGAAAELGKKIKLDDLTVVEGIGPKISELCSGIGVTTWRQLADTDVADLQSMLDAAGSRYAVHRPGTWPQQAGLLAAGAWADFKTLTDQLDGGR